ncbi:MAG TPA: hypothetical protein VE967_07465 [Gemmatimonadaceae bacterium]|nr:hypothetical protein [Gemmatimonadaceae bacterium]
MQTPAPQAAPASPSQATAACTSAIAAQAELQTQLDAALADRLAIANRLRQGGASGADLEGLNSRIVAADKHILDLQTQKAAADAAVVSAKAVPGCVLPPPIPPARGRTVKADDMLAFFFIVLVLAPISAAIARRIWKRGASTAAAIPADLNERLSRLEATMESVAIEVERIGEGQRFVTNLLIDGPGQHMLGAGGAQPVEVKQGERVANG